ncbi:LOW QUALITY PROTEIN: pentatricopeptide repeat-containing protein At1g20230-like [Pistacia vera]|uniref:LOW QUALITY PROTEIN: pentatricopeptide repeat-containing protein At1g20230-like n=1 Tax=Pistacia vera TaxID=55513 RepID=UPI001263194B|nr:LOW QUALITY PROTEIN: pentatricopeptide repeat-containing protein At1g20230-like [Pistacia vera]
MNLTKQAIPHLENIQRSIFHTLNSLNSSLSQTQQAHADILKTGVSNDMGLATKLLSQYANHQDFDDANQILSSTPEPTTCSYSTLIYAYSKQNLFTQSLRVFAQMLSHGLAPDTYLLPNIVKACTRLLSLETGKQVHAMVFVYGFYLDSFVQSSLIHLYIKCQNIGDAHKVFDRLAQPDVKTFSALLAGYARQGCVDVAKILFNVMGRLRVEPNVLSWNGMIAGFNHSGHYEEAVILFRRMHFEGFTPEEHSVSSVLSAVGDLENPKLGFQIHGFVIKQGLLENECIISSLIDMYGRCACTWNMSKVFHEMENLDVIACNAFVTGLCRNGLVENALEVFRQFQSQGVELNVVSWTSMVAGFSQNGKGIEALELFREMQTVGMKPNNVTITCLLSACGSISALMLGKAAHCFSIRRGISDAMNVSGALIDMYAKCGRIQMSRLYFDRISSRDLVSWNALLGGYAMHGKAKEAIEIFHLMQRSGQKPSSISFISVLSACSQAGLADEGCKFFDSMCKEHGIEARMEHYSCMATLLGRVGRLEEAYNMIERMPFEPDACVWGVLLSSCRVHGNVNIGEAAAKHLFELEPTNPRYYILLSNIYASKGMWNEVDAVRDMMKAMGLRKSRCYSWIEVKNKVHMLLAGDESHPQMAQIMEKLNKLNLEMKKSGYFPHADFVLQDVEEQDKEQILCGHSEKLAVVLGPLITPPGAPLQVVKNLRMCVDCDAVIKFISSFERRDIFVRDINRFLQLDVISDVV